MPDAPDKNDCKTETPVAAESDKSPKVADASYASPAATDDKPKSGPWIYYAIGLCLVFLLTFPVWQIVYVFPERIAEAYGLPAGSVSYESFAFSAEDMITVTYRADAGGAEHIIWHLSGNFYEEE